MWVCTWMRKPEHVFSLLQVLCWFLQQYEIVLGWIKCDSPLTLTQSHANQKPAKQTGASISDLLLLASHPTVLISGGTKLLVTPLFFEKRCHSGQCELSTPSALSSNTALTGPSQLLAAGVSFSESFHFLYECSKSFYMLWSRGKAGFIRSTCLVLSE